MSTVNVKITAQYFENYAYSDGGEPKWKPKGGQVFNLKMNSDHLYFDQHTLIEFFSAMLKNKSNDLCRYEYNTHEVEFSDPIELDAAEFEAEVEKMFPRKEHLVS